jgi:hypothetical protein
MDEPRTCPYCEAVVLNTNEEVEHMNKHHPEVIAQRLSEAGFHQNPVTGEWIDTWGANY